MREVQTIRVRSRPRVTPASLRAEGIVEIGRPAGTSFLFVLTRTKLHVFHAGLLPDRVLDGYAVKLAVTWIENGLDSLEVAGNLAVSPSTLRLALAGAGYKFGSRRGRLIRMTTTHQP